jgi:hypothetical protein
VGFIVFLSSCINADDQSLFQERIDICMEEDETHQEKGREEMRRGEKRLGEKR